jgi:hypothetical protein
MQLYTKPLYYYHAGIIVFLLTILVTHYNSLESSGTAQASKQDPSSVNLAKSLSTLKSTVYGPDKYGIVYIITEMEQANDYTNSIQEEQSSDPRDSAVITMQRHGTQDGMSPVYSLTVHGNGSVIYKGIRNVDTIGTQTYQIPKDKARELVNEFIKNYYFALESNTDSLDASSSDAVTTSITMNENSKTVIDDHGAYAPSTLRDLEGKIDEVTNSKQWVKHH